MRSLNGLIRRRSRDTARCRLPFPSALVGNHRLHCCLAKSNLLDDFVWVNCKWNTWRKHQYSCKKTTKVRHGKLWKTNVVWISKKKSYSVSVLRAMITFWMDKSKLKMPKMVHFGEFLKTWSLRSNSVTRLVSFNRTKIGGKCQI